MQENNIKYTQPSHKHGLNVMCQSGFTSKALETENHVFVHPDSSAFRQSMGQTC